MPESDPVPVWEEQLQKLRELREREAVPFAGHDFDDEGYHEEDACRVCLESKTVSNSCRCGRCCRLIIEVDVEDAEREPQIKEKGSPIYVPPELTASGQRELAGYLLNSAENDYA